MFEIFLRDSITGGSSFHSSTKARIAQLLIWRFQVSDYCNRKAVVPRRRVQNLRSDQIRLTVIYAHSFSYFFSLIGIVPSNGGSLINITVIVFEYY